MLRKISILLFSALLTVGCAKEKPTLDALIKQGHSLTLLLPVTTETKPATYLKISTPKMFQPNKPVSTFHSQPSPREINFIARFKTPLYSPLVLGIDSIIGIPGAPKKAHAIMKKNILSENANPRIIEETVTNHGAYTKSTLAFIGRPKGDQDVLTVIHSYSGAFDFASATSVTLMPKDFCEKTALKEAKKFLEKHTKITKSQIFG